MKNNLAFFVSILLVAGLTCCNNGKKANTYGFEFNEERLRLGLPLIENGWVPLFPINNLVEWGASKVQFKLAKPQHLMKTIRVENGLRIYEEDTYLKYENDHLSYEIEIRYTFQHSANPWSCHLITQVTRLDTMGGISDKILEEKKSVLSRKDALTMLAEWGFK